MNNKVIEGKTLYCSPALKKEDRLKEIEQDSLKYKNSKRRLNLFVKGFAPTTREEDLKPFFEAFGPIESFKIIRPDDGTKPYAFVCYYTPDAASQAKNAKIEINGQPPLTIRLYELKQQRDIQKEAADDLKGW
jgi:RNA recognition motif-containing protein